MSLSKIEWTSTVNPDGTVTPGKSWNPVRGCSRVSEGCRNCYAERMAARFSTHAQQDGDKPGGTFAGFAETRNGEPRWTGRVELIPSKLDEPLRWKKPARVFVNSMSDLFHEKLSDESLDLIFSVMALAPRHTFQVLTKRPARMRAYLGSNETMTRLVATLAMVAAGIPGIKMSGRHKPDGLDGITIPNVWLGVSVEDQATADERIPLLLQTPAAVRFVSYEPALLPIDIRTYVSPGQPWGDRFLDWVIVGGESGPGARPFNIAWARTVVGQCRMARPQVPVFVKQLGARPIAQEGVDYRDISLPRILGGGAAREQVGEVPISPLGGLALRDRKGGDPAEWPEDLRIREFPA